MRKILIALVGSSLLLTGFDAYGSSIQIPVPADTFVSSKSPDHNGEDSWLLPVSGTNVTVSEFDVSRVFVNFDLSAIEPSSGFRTDVHDAVL